MAYISIELSDEAREVIMLKKSGQQIPGKLRWIPYSKTLIALTPRNNWIRRRIIHHLIRLCKKRRQRVRTAL